MLRHRWLPLAAACVVLTGCNSATGTQPTAVATQDPIIAACPAGSITGEGAWMPRSAIDATIGAYQIRCDGKSTLDYNPSSSEAAIDAFSKGKVNWAGTEAVVPEAARTAAAARCKNNPAWSLPIAAGPITASYHLPEVDSLVLTPAVLAKISSGAITRWDDPALTQLNPSVRLPAEPITLIARDGDSPVTETITGYLHANAEADWPADKVTAAWPGTGEKAKDNTEAVAKLKATQGGLAFLDPSAAQSNLLPSASIDNGAGPVAPTPEAVTAGLGSAQLTTEGPDFTLTLDPTDRSAGAYALNTVGYAVVCSQGGGARNEVQVLRDYLKFATSEEGQQVMATVGYGTLPEPIRDQVNTQAGKIS